MSQGLKLLVLSGLVAAVSACTPRTVSEEEYVVVDPEPISGGPVYTGKYK